MPSFFYVPDMASFSMYFNFFTCLHFICVLSLFKNAFIFFTCLQFLSAFHSFILVVFIFHVLLLFYVPTFCWRAFAVLICFHIFLRVFIFVKYFYVFLVPYLSSFFLDALQCIIFSLQKPNKEGKRVIDWFFIFPNLHGDHYILSLFYVPLFLLSTIKFFAYLTCLYFFRYVTVHHLFL